MEICQGCNQNPATVQIIDVSEQWAPERAGPETAGEIALCEECAQSQGVPKALFKPPVSAIIKMLKISSLQQKQRLPSCPDCGINLLEFRQKGRLGCPKDYTVFRDFLGPLLDRVHGARRHTGRMPKGAGVPERASSDKLLRLRRQLQEAVDAEKYEEAARLRDEIRSDEQAAKDVKARGAGVAAPPEAPGEADRGAV